VTEDADHRVLGMRLQPFGSQPPDARTRAIWAELSDLPILQPWMGIATVASVLTQAISASSYLTGLIVRDPARLARSLGTSPGAHLDALIAKLTADMAAVSSLAQGMATLRVFKSEVALLCALADLGRVWPVMTVTRALSLAADAALQSAVRLLFRLAHQRGEWTPGDGSRPELGSGYVVIAMGKYGAFELNYSSDIDLIVFYDPELSGVKPGLEVPEFFVRLTRDLVRLMSERTADGYVFRCDLRLRPDAGATQIALSIDAALHYYETVGQNWERAALIKARAVAGDIARGQAFLIELSPFIWRKYLDFAAIADVHAMKRQIHAHRGFGGIGVAGHDVKLGPGGIREIEFFVQTQQLIAGGRQSTLRSAETLTALELLRSHGWISGTVVAELAAAYQFLRTIEHRAQMVADEQTHAIPKDQHALATFARFAGYDTVDAFSRDVTKVLSTVQGHYSRLFEAAPQLTAGSANMVLAGEADDPATLSALDGMGFAQPSQVLATVRGWHHGRYRSMRSPRSRERLTEVQARLIEALSQTADPGQALANFDRFLADLPSGIQLFALLRTKPGLLQLLADIMGSAPRLARILSRRRRLFDAVLDPSAFGTLPTSAVYDRLLSDGVPRDTDFETVLDAARIVGSEQAFLIGVRTLAGTLPPGDAGAAYAALADSVIAALHTRIAEDMEQVHGRFPDSGAVVVAMGKLGGREMTATSDLDLIVIYDAPAAALTGEQLSDGAKPLAAPVYYARLTQRLVAALSAPTTEGTLYAVDLRLRPSGQKGPLATSLPSFVAYQAAEAWTWEHMALTRARVISGPPALRVRVEAAISETLRRPRDAAKISSDVREMRTRMVKERSSADIWDLKYVRGGVVDVEFIIQYLQLVHASAHPAVLTSNTRSAVCELAAAGLVTAPDADALRAAIRLYANLVGLLRLMSDGPFHAVSAPQGLKQRLTLLAGQPDFSSLESHIRETLDRMHGLFDRIVHGQ